MKIELKKYGTFLISRPEGRDAALVLRHQFLDIQKPTEVEIDFKEVKVMTPSWLDEFLQEIFKTVPREKVTYSNTENKSVKGSLETVLEV